MLCLSLLTTLGCIATTNIASLPDKNELVRDQLVVHSDFELPKHHRLIDDLVVRRAEIANLLGIQPGQEPIHVYLFDTPQRFRSYVRKSHPDFPDRRALFVKRDERLMVYTMWSPRVGEDLRHEVTHGYLHSVVRGLPLWLDEGIAEFFEVERGQQGLNTAHLFLLTNELAADRWSPDLEHLEALDDAAAMSQLEYAEAWLWTHFLLSNEEAYRKPILQAHLQQLVKQGEAFAISAAVQREYPNAEQLLLEHLDRLNRQ